MMKTKKQKIMVITLVAFGVVALLASTLNSFYPGPTGFLVVVPSIILLLLGLIVLFVLFVVAAIRGQKDRRNRRGLGFALAVPVVLCGLMLGDYVHLLVGYPHYRGVIASYPRQDVGPLRFPWGDAAVTVLDGSQPRTLIYDTSDATKAHVGQSMKDDQGNTTNTRHFIGPFYLEETSP